MRKVFYTKLEIAFFEFLDFISVFCSNCKTSLPHFLLYTTSINNLKKKYLKNKIFFDVYLAFESYSLWIGLNFEGIFN